jgi:hypothetical protein
MYKKGSGRPYLCASPFCRILEHLQQSAVETVRGGSRKLLIQLKKVQKIFRLCLKFNLHKVQTLSHGLSTVVHKVWHVEVMFCNTDGF